MLMRPCVFTIVSQSVIVPAELKLYKQARTEFTTRQLDMFHDNLQSVKNLLGAFHSLRTAHSMITRYAKSSNINYTAVIVLRPDTAMLSDIDIAQYLPQIVEEESQSARGARVNQSIWVPDFQHWSGCNDRAAYGSPRVMSSYMLRGTAFRDRTGAGNSSFSRNGEVYLQLYLHEHEIIVRPSALRVVRVRVDGSVPLLDTLQKEMNMDDAAFRRYSQDCLYYKTKKVTCRTFMCSLLEAMGYPTLERAGSALYNSVSC
jgi:hypothetical protein